jgi:hypothetical protein
MARKPPALARELLRNFPKRRGRSKRRRRRSGEPFAGETGATLEHALNGSGPHERAPADVAAVAESRANGAAAKREDSAHATQAQSGALDEQNVRLDAQIRLAERSDGGAEVAPRVVDAVAAKPAARRNGRRRSAPRRQGPPADGQASAGAADNGEAGAAAGEGATD